MTERRVADAYRTSNRLVENGISIFVEYDALGERIDQLSRKVYSASRLDPEEFGEFSDWCRRLGWLWCHCLFDLDAGSPSPTFFDDIEKFVNYQFRRTSDRTLIGEFISILNAIGESPISAMVNSVVETVATFGAYETGGVTLPIPEAVVAVKSRNFADPLANFLSERGIQSPVVTTIHELRKSNFEFESVICLGPPSTFKASLWGAPIAEELTYIVPHWFTTLALPDFEMQVRPDSPIKPKTKVFRDPLVSISSTPSPVEIPLVPDTPEESIGSEHSSEDEFGSPKKDGWSDAYEVTFIDGSSILLSQADQVRTIQASNGSHGSIMFKDPGEIDTGDILLIRTGASEEDLIDAETASILGSGLGAIESTQKNWKDLLQRELDRKGFLLLERLLRERGVKSSHRIESWTDRRFIAPRNEQDFIVLLEWLGVDSRETLKNSKELARARRSAKDKIRRDLEQVSAQLGKRSLEEGGSVDLSAIFGREMNAIVGVVRESNVHGPRVRTRDLKTIRRKGFEPWRD